MASRKRGSKDEAPRWAWMLFGLSIGLVVALVVYLMSGDSDVGLSEPPPAAAEREPEREPARVTRNATPPTGEAEAEEEFSFFRTLPESEVVVPEGGGPARSSSSAEPAQEYIIQAGSYSSYAEADSAQARLALLGIESKVERAIVGNELRLRVIIGPLSDRNEIESTVRRLNAENIESMPPRPVSN